MSLFMKLFGLEEEPEDYNRRAFFRDIGSDIAAFSGLSLLAGCVVPAEERSGRVRSTGIDFGHRLLELEKDFGEKVGGSEHRKLDRLLKKTGRRVMVRDSYTKGQALGVLSAINGVLDEEGYEYEWALGSFANMLRKGRRNCGTGSNFYLAVADMANLPLTYVCGKSILPSGVPHAWVRWRFSNGSYFNWETTSGKEKSDREYLADYKDLEEWTAREIIARRLAYRGFFNVSFEGLEPEKGLGDCDEAVRISPDHRVFGIRGDLKRDLKDFEGAIQDYERSISLEPQYSEQIYYSLSDAYRRSGNMAAAKEVLEMGQKAYPTGLFRDAIERLKRVRDN